MVEIFDPPILNAHIGSPAALGYVENIVETVVTDILAGKIALLCNYIAAGFPAAVHGHRDTLIAEAQAQRRTLLTHPPEGLDGTLGELFSKGRSTRRGGGAMKASVVCAGFLLVLTGEAAGDALASANLVIQDVARSLPAKIRWMFSCREFA